MPDGEMVVLTRESGWQLRQHVHTGLLRWVPPFDVEGYGPRTKAEMPMVPKGWKMVSRSDIPPTLADAKMVRIMGCWLDVEKVA